MRKLLSGRRGTVRRRNPTAADRGHANFHEKALFVKADVAAAFVVERYDSVSFAMLPSALLMSQLSSDPVHYEILLFGLLRRRCNLRIGLSSSRRVDQVRNLRSRLI
jgi:hypothetical protein